MWYRKHYMIVCRWKQLYRQVFYPLFFLQSAAVRAMAVATTMVLLVQMIAVSIIATIVVHAHGRRMATEQTAKNMLAYHVKLLYARVCKQLLKVSTRHTYSRTHDCPVATVCAACMAS